jgi:hypothetical protein
MNHKSLILHRKPQTLTQVSPRAHNLALDALTDIHMANLRRAGEAGDAEIKERRSLLLSAQVPLQTPYIYHPTTLSTTLNPIQ